QYQGRAAAGAARASRQREGITHRDDIRRDASDVRAAAAEILRDRAGFFGELSGSPSPPCRRGSLRAAKRGEGLHPRIETLIRRASADARPFPHKGRRESPCHTFHAPTLQPLIWLAPTAFVLP